MQLYWKCTECDETNRYPEVTECEVCGAPMTAEAEQEALRQKKAEEERLERLKREEEQRRKEEERRRQEAERKRREAEIAAQKAEAEKRRLENLERVMKAKENREIKLGKAVRGVGKTFSIVFRIAAAAAVVISIGPIFSSFGTVADNVAQKVETEYEYHTVEGENEDEKVLRSFWKIGNQFELMIKAPVRNISEQYEFIKSNFSPIENTVELIETVTDEAPMIFNDIIGFFGGDS